MPRENIKQLVDAESFQEYWPLIVAQQHTRHDIDKLRKNTPTDGVIAGTASVNGELFKDEMSRGMVVSYDYTVLAGTQGHRGHCDCFAAFRPSASRVLDCRFDSVSQQRPLSGSHKQGPSVGPNLFKLG